MVSDNITITWSGHHDVLFHKIAIALSAFNNRRRIHFLHIDGVWTSRFRHPLKPGDGNGTAGNRKRESDIHTWIHIHHSAPPAHSAIRHN